MAESLTNQAQRPFFLPKITEKISPLVSVSNCSENRKMQISKRILSGFDYIYKNYLKQNEKEVDIICQEISQSIQDAYNKGAFILPKSSQDIKTAILENRLVAIFGRDLDNKLHVLASSMYSILGVSQRKAVLEVGGLIVSSKYGIRGSGKELIFLINDGGTLAQNQSFGTQILEATVKLAKQNHPESLIIATTRSQKSQSALENAGFIVKSWDKEKSNLSQLSCDFRCRDVNDHTNCQFMDKSCKLMVYIK